MVCASFDDAMARNHEAIVAFMRRDTQPFKDLYSRRDDATLANPFGDVARGWDEIAPRIDQAASYYADGEAVSVQTVSVDHADDFGYCLEIERLRGRVGGRDVVDEVALRTTSVFRCEDAHRRLA